MSDCCCPNITVTPEQTPVLQVSTPCQPVLNVVMGERAFPGKDATINGYNVVTITAEDGIALVQNENVLTISGENLLSRVDTASVVYGTDENGDQTTYPLADLGKVQDVTVDGVSVVTNSVAELGTMALASASDYRTSAEQNVIDEGKQDVISDLSTIRSNATAGKAASDTIATYGNIVTHNVSEFATAEQGSLADTAVQPSDLATVATTGSYNDLLNKPTIPTVNDATLTVQKNGTSVGTFTANANTDSTINITVPTAVSELANDSNFIDLTNISATSPIAYNNATGVISVENGYAIPTTTQVSQITTNKDDIATNSQAIGTETTNRENADIALQRQIDAIVSSSDVFDIVGTYAELQAYDISTVPVNDIIKVLVDETRDNAATYYRCVENGGVKSWSYIGSEGAYYTKGEANSLFVPQTRTINNKALSDNISLTASDVGALQANDDISLLNNNSGYITLTSLSATGSIAYNNETGVIGVASGYQIPTTAQVTSIGTALQPNDNISELTNDSGFITSSALTPYALSASLSTVATSGSYNDLLDKPTIGNATLTIQKNGSSVGTFTANATSNESVNITVPTATSDLTNDSGYITGISSGDVTTALGYTPYNSSNPDGYITLSGISATSPIAYSSSTGVISVASGYQIPTTTQVTAIGTALQPNDNVSSLNNDAGYITGITSSDVTTALGYTPYNSTNPSGYQANVIESIEVNGTAQTITSKTVDIAVPTDNNQLTNGAGYITGISSSDVTTALGYTPANVTLSNLTNAGNIYGSSLAMPSNTKTSITVGASGTQYTAPANGWFYVNGEPTASNQSLYLWNVTKSYGTSAASVTSSRLYRLMIPVTKNDVVDLTYSMTIRDFSFIYAVGSESEA